MTDWLRPATRQRLAEEQARKAALQSADLPIFDQPPDNGTATSKAAAQRVAPHTGTQRHRILAALLKHPQGLTRAELVRVTGLSENAVNPRSRSLLDSGLIFESGERDHRSVLHAKRGEVSDAA